MIGISIRFCSSIHTSPIPAGSCHGSTTAITSISMAERPLWLNQPMAIADTVSTVRPIRRLMVGSPSWRFRVELRVSST